jgi:pyrimidine deaminase RibD-like protein
MFLRELLNETLTRTGHGSTAVVGWGRGMGHKGHMYLASAVIHKAQEVGGDPYFVVSRTVGKDDPINPEEKMAIYKKVFPDSSHIFQTATDEMPDLTRVLSNLNQQGYTNAIVVVGADQVKALAYVKNYNNTPDKTGKVHYKFDNLEVISRQETSAPDAQEEGPRATPMRQVLMDPAATEEQKFAVWRDAMNPEIDDQQVLDLMHKAEQRMKAIPAAKTKKVKEAMMPKKNFAGSSKNKLGPAGHLKGKMKRAAKAGDLVGAMEAFDSGSPVGGKRGSGAPHSGYDMDAMRLSTGTMEDDSDDFEVHGYHHLDELLAGLCKLVVEGHKQDPDRNGMVAAGIKTKLYPFMARVGYMGKHGHVHAERAVLEAFTSKHGEVPEGSIMLVTLSPCNRHDDKTASERVGEPCSELVAAHGIEKVYCGLIDPSQAHGGHDHRHYTLIETENSKIRDLCEQFANTFLHGKERLYESTSFIGALRNQLNRWMDKDQKFKDPSQRIQFQEEIWPQIEKYLVYILEDRGPKGDGDYPSSPFAAWLLVQHMDAFPNRQREFLNALEQYIPNHPKIQFLRDRLAVNEWVMEHYTEKNFYHNGKPLPNPTVNIRNPAYFKDAGIKAGSRSEALANAEKAGNVLLVAAVNATGATTQPSYTQTSESIDESLDSAYKFKYAGMDGDNVTIYSFTPSGGSKINVSIFYEERTGTGHVTFYRASDDSEEMTGEHPFDAAKVLGTVKAIVVYHTKRHPEIKNISFQAAKKDLGRLRAYNAIAKRFGGSSNPDYHKKYASYEFPNVAMAEEDQTKQKDRLWKIANRHDTPIHIFSAPNYKTAEEYAEHWVNSHYDELGDKLGKNRGYLVRPHRENYFYTNLHTATKLGGPLYKDQKTDEEAAGVGIVTKQNSTADVGPGTIRKNLKAFKL